jgi:regulator of ribosome biosynthesis
MAEQIEEHVALDLHHLSATYKVPAGTGAALTAQARDATQLLVAGLFALPVEKTNEGPVVTLPTATTALPREKPVPVPRAETKWEKFAKDKGIVPNKAKKSRMAWDEERDKWAPTWGYDKAGGEEEDRAIIEVSEADVREGIDPREEARAEKRGRVAKNAAQRDANDARARKKKRGGDPDAALSGLPVDLHDQGRLGKKKGKLGVKGALERAQVATASLGQFDAKVEGEGKRPTGPARGRKRQFLPAAPSGGSDAQRGAAMLAEIERPRARAPKKGQAERMDTHDGDLPNESGFKRKKGKAAAGKMKKITKKRGV